LAVCPGESVSGALMPVILNPAPEVEIWEIVMLTFPPLVTAMGWVLLVPTLTLLKFQLAGFGVSCAIGVTTPVPVKGKLVGEPEAVLTTETLPLTLPAAVGAKTTLNAELERAANVNGRVSPVTL
jgi:hypothetical protein